MADSTTRANKKRAVTKQMNLIKQLLAEDEGEKVEQEVVVLKRLFRDFTEANDEHSNKLEEESELEECDAYFAAVQANYIDVLSQAKACMRAAIPIPENTTVKCSKFDDPTPSDNKADLTREELLSLMNLPKLTLEKFNGNPLDYHAFIATFDQNIGNVPCSDTSKLARLLENTTGDAR